MTFAFCCTDIGTAVGPERAHDVLLLGATGGDVAELIRADGSPGGYRWGLPLKEKILRREGACDNAA